MKRGPVIAVSGLGFVTFLFVQARFRSVSPEEKAAVAALPWLTDFETARARSQAENKPLFIDFTGSDWCPPCMRLRKEVFSKPEFADFAARKLVLLEVDFPKREPLPPEQQAANEALARQFNIEGFPTIIVVSPSGKILGQLGFMSGGAPAFLAALKGIVERG